MTKAELRKQIKSLLSQIEKKQLEEESRILVSRIFDLEEFCSADMVFSFLPAGKELDVRPVVQKCLEEKKKILVPRVYGASHEMDFYFLAPCADGSCDYLSVIEEQCEAGAFGIVEPKECCLRMDLGDSENEFTYKQRGAESENNDSSTVKSCFIDKQGTLDSKSCFINKQDPAEKILVIVPGLAFSKRGDRLGHGMAFYDIYLSRLKKYAAWNGIKLFLLGVCADQQLVEEIPSESTDIKMDAVLTPSYFASFE